MLVCICSCTHTRTHTRARALSHFFRGCRLQVLICDSSGATSAQSLSSLALALASLFPGAFSAPQHSARATAPPAPASPSASALLGDVNVCDTTALLLEKSIAAFTQEQERAWLEAGERRRAVDGADPIVPGGARGCDANTGSSSADGDGSSADGDDVLGSFDAHLKRMNVQLLCPHPGLTRIFPHACLQQAGWLLPKQCKQEREGGKGGMRRVCL